jgi:hypothetical protein
MRARNALVTLGTLLAFAIIAAPAYAETSPDTPTTSVDTPSPSPTPTPSYHYVANDTGKFAADNLSLYFSVGDNYSSRYRFDQMVTSDNGYVYQSWTECTTCAAYKLHKSISRGGVISYKLLTPLGSKVTQFTYTYVGKGDNHYYVTTTARQLPLCINVTTSLGQYTSKAQLTSVTAQVADPRFGAVPIYDNVCVGDCYFGGPMKLRRQG